MNRSTWNLTQHINRVEAIYVWSFDYPHTCMFAIFHPSLWALLSPWMRKLHFIVFGCEYIEYLHVTTLMMLMNTVLWIQTCEIYRDHCLSDAKLHLRKTLEFRICEGTEMPSGATSWRPPRFGHPQFKLQTQFFWREPETVVWWAVA